MENFTLKKMFAKQIEALEQKKTGQNSGEFRGNIKLLVRSFTTLFSTLVHGYISKTMVYTGFLRLCIILQCVSLN